MASKSLSPLTFSATTFFTNWTDCYNRQLKTDARFKDNVDLKKFYNDGGYDLLAGFEESLDCASTCKVPLFYLTKNTTEGRPTEECISAFVDKLSTSMKPAAYAALGLGVVLLCACIGTYPLCGCCRDPKEPGNGALDVNPDEPLEVITEFESPCKLNDTIKALNGVIEAWNALNDPIRENKDAAVEAAGFEGPMKNIANVKHVLLGMIIAGVADSEKSWDEIKGEMGFDLSIPAPYLKLGMFEKYAGVIAALPPAAICYIEALGKVPDLITSLVPVPESIIEGVKNAKTDFESMSFFAKAKAIIDCINIGKELVTKSKILLNQLQNFSKNAGDFKDAVGQVKDDIDSGELQNRAKRAGKNCSIPMAYVKGYGKLM